MALTSDWAIAAMTGSTSTGRFNSRLSVVAGRAKVVGELGDVEVDVHADADDHDAGTRRRALFAEDAGDFAVGDQDVVGPLDA